jgi:glycosyltransferase involved in cell wall biosynthesis
MRGAWSAIVPAADSFNDVADLVFVGDGVDAPTVRSLAGAAGNVTIREPVPRAEMNGLLLSADVLIVTVRRGAEGYTVPSKTYELFGAGRPIVVVADADTEPALLVREIGCGLVVSPDAPDEFGAAVRKLAADPELRRSMGEAAKRVSPDYDRRKMMDRIVDIADEVVS